MIGARDEPRSRRSFSDDAMGPLPSGKMIVGDATRDGDAESARWRARTHSVLNATFMTKDICAKTRTRAAVPLRRVQCRRSGKASR